MKRHVLKESIRWKKAYLPLAFIGLGVLASAFSTEAISPHQDRLASENSQSPDSLSFSARLKHLTALKNSNTDLSLRKDPVPGKMEERPQGDSNTLNTKDLEERSSALAQTWKERSEEYNELLASGDEEEAFELFEQVLFPIFEERFEVARKRIALSSKR